MPSCYARAQLSPMLKADKNSIALFSEAISVLLPQNNCSRNLILPFLISHTHISTRRYSCFASSRYLRLPVFISRHVKRRNYIYPFYMAAFPVPIPACRLFGIQPQGFPVHPFPGKKPGDLIMADCPVRQFRQSGRCRCPVLSNRQSLGKHRFMRMRINRCYFNANVNFVDTFA
jgi:hypothetical protein